jgi:hypothetical protein
LAIPVYFGVRSFGRIDDSQGGHVATRFFHIYYLPLIPVGGAREGADGAARTAPLHLGSLLIAYFKWIGFLGAAGLTALAFNEVERPASNVGFLLGGAALILGCAVVASWAWIGDRRATAQARMLSLAVPVVVIGGALGWAFKERLHRQSLPSYAFAERRTAYQATHPGTSDLDYVFGQLRTVVESERTPPPIRDCTGARFITGRFEGRDLLGADGEQLARLVSSRSVDASKQWLMSRPLLDLVGSYPEGALFSISERPYLAVLRPGAVRIYDLIEGRYLCGAPFSSAARGGEYLEALSVAVKKITRDVYVDFNSSDGHLD